MSWHRIKKPQQCVCGKSDWCLVNDTATEFLCMRVVSNKVICLSDGSIGYVHKVAGSVATIPQQPREKPAHLSTDAIEQILSRAERRTSGSQLNSLAESLGVRCSALQEMRVAYGNWHTVKDGRHRDYEAWLFPMRDGNGNLIGLRARAHDGSKWSVDGSRNGLFYPYCEPENELWVVEGGTDTAALRSLNLFVIGRPSCSGGMNEIKVLIARLGIRRVYIIGDNDEDKKRPDGSTYNPGVDGAESLARNLPVPSCTVVLPCKDVREGVRECGLNYETLMALTNTAVWRNP
jgi:hypothetical protein